MSAAIKVGSFVCTYGTKIVLGAGYMALRGAYALGEAGEAAVACSEVEAKRLGVQHDAMMITQRQQAEVRKAELRARLAALQVPPAVANAVAAPMVAVAAPMVAGKTAKA